MKKSIFLLALFALIPLVAQAGSYNNKTYNFSMNYPAGWSKQEMKLPTAGQVIGGAAGSAASREIPFSKEGAIGWGQGVAESAAGAAIGYGVMKGAMKDMPKFASVTFTNKARSDAQIMLTVMEGTGGGVPGAGSGGSGCKTLKKGKVSWGGRNAQHFAMRCRQGQQWQYTTSATLKKDGSSYSLLGFMTLDSADDEAYSKYLGNAFNTMLSSTSFR